MIVFKIIWLDIVRFWWVVMYAMATRPGQITPENPWQARLFSKALAATLNVELLLAAHSRKTR